jgi:hypothetical protein
MSFSYDAVSPCNGYMSLMWYDSFYRRSDIVYPRYFTALSQSNRLEAEDKYLNSSLVIHGYCSWLHRESLEWTSVALPLR